MLTEKPKPRPTAFVGSSSESRAIAEAILQNLADKVEITCWYHHDFFELTSSVLDDLIAKVSHFDFGVFIFAPDDTVKIRQHSVGSVRDNVLFELGLFLGILGKERVFIVATPEFSGDAGAHRLTWTQRCAVSGAGRWQAGRRAGDSLQEIARCNEGRRAETQASQPENRFGAVPIGGTASLGFDASRFYCRRNTDWGREFCSDQ